MNLLQKELTMRIYEPLAFIQKMLEETMLLAAEIAFLNWNITKGITLIHVIRKIQETIGTTETPLSKTYVNIHTFKENERGRESDLRLIAAGGALLIQDDLLLPQSHLHHLNVHPETLNDVFIVSPLNEVVVQAHCHHHTLTNQKRTCWSIPLKVTRLKRALSQIVWQVLRKRNVQSEKRRVTRTRLTRLNQGKQRGNHHPTLCLKRTLKLD